MSMNREKELVAVLTAMVETVRKHEGHYFTFDDEERFMYRRAVELLTQIAQDCDDCVDY